MYSHTCKCIHVIHIIHVNVCARVYDKDEFRLN